MTPYKLTVIKLCELKTCTVVCGKCKTSVEIGLGRNDVIPEKCPACGEKYHDTLRQAISGLKEAHAYADKRDFEIEFHIRESQSVGIGN
jgi:tRNA(Ile2) C34 agmatinyltransferase TiaS